MWLQPKVAEKEQPRELPDAEDAKVTQRTQKKTKKKTKKRGK
jgi:hypothetical protein